MKKYLTIALFISCTKVQNNDYVNGGNRVMGDTLPLIYVDSIPQVNNLVLKLYSKDSIGPWTIKKPQ